MHNININIKKKTFPIHEMPILFKSTLKTMFILSIAKKK